jgi:hypothetical protein
MAKPAQAGAAKSPTAVLGDTFSKQPMSAVTQSDGMRRELQPADNEPKFLEAQP